MVQDIFVPRHAAGNAPPGIVLCGGLIHACGRASVSSSQSSQTRMTPTAGIRRCLRRAAHRPCIRDGARGAHSEATSYLCLFALPAIAAASGMGTAWLLRAAFCALGFLLLAGLYKVPSQADLAVVPRAAAWPRRLSIRAMIVAGTIWGLFNARWEMVRLRYILLVKRGWSLAAAGSATTWYCGS
jgi:hypothetical protein